MAIVTVRGEISDYELGPVLSHEHLICDFSDTGTADNRMLDPQLTAIELSYFKQVGGRGIFEVTPVGLGDDPQALRQISDITGVHIVRGISFYVEQTYPDWIWSATVEKIADFFTREIEEGRDGIRAGLIGEVASHNEIGLTDPAQYRLREAESKVFRAAALAQKRTGVAISTHAWGRAGHAQLEVLEAAAADLSRVIIGHCDSYTAGEELDMAYYLRILSCGSCIQFDLVGWNCEYPGIMTDEHRATCLASLIRQGYGRQLLISMDTCRLSQLHANGGRGYDYVWTHFLPLLRGTGVSEESIEEILVNNPRRLAAIS